MPVNVGEEDTRTPQGGRGDTGQAREGASKPAGGGYWRE